ncbi:MAG TPA: RcnB family protein [Burkholderiales bacterium]
MKMKQSLCALVALSLAGGTAFAQPRDDHRAPEHRPPEHHAPARHAPPPRDHHGERGAGPQHSFYKGERLPTEYRNRQYVVDDWRGHHLSSPPRGYHWVQTGGDYVLAAVATGIIAQLVFGGN